MGGVFNPQYALEIEIGIVLQQPPDAPVVVFRIIHDRRSDPDIPGLERLGRRYSFVVGRGGGRYCCDERRQVHQHQASRQFSCHLMPPPNLDVLFSSCTTQRRILIATAELPDVVVCRTFLRINEPVSIISQ